MRGPYMNDDGDWWVPVEDVPSFAEGRAQVVACLSYDIPYDGRLAYVGRQMATLDDEHTADEIGPACTATCSRRVLAYHFEERRLW